MNGVLSLLDCEISIALPIVYCSFFNDTATSEIYTLSLHDALPIFPSDVRWLYRHGVPRPAPSKSLRRAEGPRSEEHTSELQSRPHLVCRLLLEKKKRQSRLRRPLVAG